MWYKSVNHHFDCLKWYCKLTSHFSISELTPAKLDKQCPYAPYMEYLPTIALIITQM